MDGGTHHRVFEVQRPSRLQDAGDGQVVGRALSRGVVELRQRGGVAHGHVKS